MPNIIPIGLLPAGAGPFTTVVRRQPGDRITSLVNEADFASAHTILRASTAGVPQALVIAAQNLVGRAATGGIASLTPATVRSLLNVANGSQANAGTQLVASTATIKNIFKQLTGGTGAHEYRGLQTGSPTILTLAEDGTLVTLTITPAGILIGDLGNVDLTTTPPIIGDVLEFDGSTWVPVPNAGGGGGLTVVEDDLTPRLGGNLRNGGFSFVSEAGQDIDLVPAAGRDVEVTVSGGGAFKVNGQAALPVNTGTPARGDIIRHDGAEYAKLALGNQWWVLGSDGTDVRYLGNTKPFSCTLQNPTARTYGIGFVRLGCTVINANAFIDGDASASATYTIKRGGTRSAAGTEILASQTVSTAGVQQRVNSAGFTDAQVPGSSFVWADVTAVAGVIDTLEFSVVIQEN